MPEIYISSSVDGELIRYVEECLGSAGQTQRFVTVSEPAYRAAANKGKFARIGLRLRMYAWHPLRLAVRMLVSAKGSVWVVTTNPFFAPGLAALVGRIRGQRVVHLLYDLFPDALEEAGLIRREGAVACGLGFFPRMALRHSDVTVFLGEHLKAHAEGRWGKAKRSAVIPVVLSEPQGDCPAEEGGTEVEIHYGGQLGWMHDAELLAKLLAGCVENAEATFKTGIHWSFRVSGAKAKAFADAVDGLGFEVGPTLPVEAWRKRALKAEVGLVTLSEGGARVCLPSKTYGMMACGMAILALCPKNSDLGQLIELADVGWVVDSSSDENTEQLQANFNQTVQSIVENPRELLRRRENALKLIQSENEKDMEQHRWSELVS